MSAEMLGPGCGVTVLGRAGLRYREGNDTVRISGEMLVGEADFVIGAASIRFWEGSGTPIDDAKRAEIVANIQETFRLNGLKLVVD